MAKVASQQELDAISDACFSYLVNDVEELQRFMAITGHDADSLRRAVGTRELTLGMLDYFAGNEAALMAMCANAGFRAEAVMRVWHRLNADG